ncbi:hypothetical protein L1077_08770 [Pseudoalteromonas luteoviolacea]|uniref:hypothetical protein n=1 Tax=Pseudoalteromonas luteoviolacea TaxID=43657 RepID=UPI001F36EFA7|nr:hypothetical protein [Pseudoalteromonas luteoviolacea]MCF6439518.1 hypothetical protein [Pseudoalteromonas luteoviolacea]
MKKLTASIFSLFASGANASDDWVDFVTTAHNSLSEKQESIMAEYKIGEHERFDWEQENGTLVYLKIMKLSPMKNGLPMR